MVKKRSERAHSPRNPRRLPPSGGKADTRVRFQDYRSSPRNPGHGSLGELKLSRNRSQAHTRRAHFANLTAVTNHPGAAELFPLAPGASQASQRALADSDALLLRDGGQDTQHSVAKDAAGVQVLLSVRPPVYAVPVELLKVLERFEHAF